MVAYSPAMGSFLVVADFAVRFHHGLGTSHAGGSLFLSCCLGGLVVMGRVSRMDEIECIQSVD